MRAVNAVKKIASEASRKEPVAFWALFSVYAASTIAGAFGAVCYIVATGLIVFAVFFFCMFLVGSLSYLIGSAYLLCLLEGITPKPFGIAYRNQPDWGENQGRRENHVLFWVFALGVAVILIGLLAGVEALLGMPVS